MKRILNQLFFAAALMCGAMAVASCQGLIDAVFGEHAGSSSGSTTKPVTPDDPKPPTYASDAERPLTFEATVDGVTVTFKFKDGALPDYKKVEYSLDGGATWTALSGPAQPILLEKAGDIVMFRGDNPTYNGDAQFVIEESTSKTRGETIGNLIRFTAMLYGNLNKLSQGIRENTEKEQLIEKEYTYKSLFKNTHIDAQSADGQKKLVIPDKELAKGSLQGLFEGSTISVAPTLDVTELTTDCLKDMCKDCQYLKEMKLSFERVAPGLTLDDCVGGMLENAGSSADLKLRLEMPSGGSLGTADFVRASGANKLTIISDDESSHRFSQDADGTIYDEYTDQNGIKHLTIFNTDGTVNYIINTYSFNFVQEDYSDGGDPTAASTRTLTGTSDGKTIAAKWEKGDQVALIYGETIDVLEVANVNATTGATTFSGTITNPKNDETVYVVYVGHDPANMTEYVSFLEELYEVYKMEVPESDAIPIAKISEPVYGLLATQDGTLKSISDKCDFRISSSTFNIEEDGTVTFPSEVKLPAQCAIWKLNLTTDGSTALKAKKLVMKKDGEEDVIIDLGTETSSEFYIAFIASASTYSFEATSSNDIIYTCSPTVSTLDAGKFYRSTLKMASSQ